MQYFGGVLSGAQKIGFTCIFNEEAETRRHTLSAWNAARENDEKASYFVTPLQGSEKEASH